MMYNKRQNNIVGISTILSNYTEEVGHICEKVMENSFLSLHCHVLRAASFL